jgi:Meiotically up-regulated gene 113
MMLAMSGYAREEIVAAIQQATAHDGGKPVGMTRFETLTGITRRTWQGIYWATWGDALREAGYEPNALDQRRGEDERLTEAASMVRRLGKVPTENELRLASRDDPTLPSRNAIRALGGRDQVAAKLRQLAQSDSSYTDLLELLPEAATTESDGIPVRPMSPAVTGQVYLARMGKHHKIGRTGAVGRRMYELAIQLPEALSLVHVLETDDPEGIERYWHQRFASKRTNGEWFLLTREDILAFKRRGRFM